MQYRLEEEHQAYEQVLPAGTIVGDGTPFPWRYETDVRANFEGKGAAKAGDPMPPSRAMTPLDDEAHRLFQKHFNNEAPPPRDPTASIPLQGTGDKTLVKPSPAPAAPTSQAKAAPHVPGNVDHDVAPKTGLGAEPKAHDSAKNPGDSKDTETAKTPDVKKL